jgi:hypothetical protein
MTRRHVDNQTRDLAAPDPVQLMGDCGDVPVRQTGLTGVERHQAASEERLEVLSHNQIV